MSVPVNEAVRAEVDRLVQITHASFVLVGGGGDSADDLRRMPFEEVVGLALSNGVIMGVGLPGSILTGNGVYLVPKEGD